MNTSGIFDDLKHCCCGLKNVFVLPANLLPVRRIRSRPLAFVLNTDNSRSKGQHWIALYVPKNNGDIEYFDSGGRPPTNKRWLKFIKNNCNRYIYNPIQIQSFISEMCGEFCITYLNERICKKKSLKEYIDQFNTKDLEMNDNTVKRLYNNIQKTKNKKKKKKITQSGRGVGHIKLLDCSNPQNGGVVYNQTCISIECATEKKNRKRIQ